MTDWLMDCQTKKKGNKLFLPLLKCVNLNDDQWVRNPRDQAAREVITDTLSSIGQGLLLRKLDKLELRRDLDPGPGRRPAPSSSREVIRAGARR